MSYDAGLKKTYNVSENAGSAYPGRKYKSQNRKLKNLHAYREEQNIVSDVQHVLGEGNLRKKNSSKASLAKNALSSTGRI